MLATNSPVLLGFAADPASVDSMRLATTGALDPATQCIRRWLVERTVTAATASRAALLHADFRRWCADEGLPELRLAAFARRLHALGIEGSLHSRTRRSWFRLALLREQEV